MADRKPTIKSVRSATGDRLRLADHTLVICQQGTNQPYCEVKPGYNPGIGAHITFYRVAALDPSKKEPVLTFGVGGIGSLIRLLPLVIAAARRLESSARKANSKKHP